MASNSYDNNYYSSNRYDPPQPSSYSNAYDDRRTEAPLPPLPYDSSPSPFGEPHRQPTNNLYGQSSADPYQQASHDPYRDPSAAPSSRYDRDPYDDQNAIPLDERGRKHGSMHSVAPILPPQQPDDDPFVRDAKPGKSRRRRGSGRADKDDDDGWFRGKITWVCFFMSTVQLAVFLAEIIKYGMLTGTPIQIKPSFNPMIGPSPYLYINMGARFQPCMHNMDGIQNAQGNAFPVQFPCPGTTSTDQADNECTLSQLCGFGGVPEPHFEDGKLRNNPAPNQWWRFIVPIFLHGGIIHIAFNLLLQLTLGRDVEKLIGSIRFFIVYMAAGIFGFVLGGNFAATGIASTGASGSLFGILAITLLDLLYNWSTRTSPVKELLFIAIDIIIAFVLGLLPGLDNFSHIGGFLMGLVLGVCILRSPSAVSRRTSADFTGRSKYDPNAGLVGFVKKPLAFFQNRRGVWWAWWLLRAAALLGVLIGFILLLRNFYEWRTGCSWCKHLSCLPIKTSGGDWCSIGNLQFEETKNSTSPA